MRKKLFIVIPVYNRIDYTKACLNSLLSQSYKDFRIILIDDGSTDGTSEIAGKEYPEVILLKGNGNLWWAGATNLGVKYSLEHGADYILTLNNDTEASEDYIEKMMFWADRYPEALMGSFAFDINSGRPVYGGEIINWKKADSTYLLDFISIENQTGLQEVSHYSGRGLLIPSKVYRTVGFYNDKDFPQTAADDDFAHRALRYGYKIFVNYDAKLFIYPKESGESKLRENKGLRNYYYHLFGIKGGGNLIFFTKYVIRNCPLKYRPFFLFRGYIQRILGYWIR